MKHSSDTFCLAAAIILGGTVPVRADVKLPALFSDHMVVQAGSAVPVWGVGRTGRGSHRLVCRAIEDDEGRR